MTVVTRFFKDNCYVFGHRVSGTNGVRLAAAVIFLHWEKLYNNQDDQQSNQYFFEHKKRLRLVKRDEYLMFQSKIQVVAAGYFSVSSSQLKNSLCHTRPFCGCNTQWFSLGR